MLTKSFVRQRLYLLLLELKEMLITAPEQYYVTVREMGLSGTDVLKLTNGLRKINDATL